MIHLLVNCTQRDPSNGVHQCDRLCSSNQYFLMLRILWAQQCVHNIICTWNYVCTWCHSKYMVYKVEYLICTVLGCTYHT